MGQYREWRHYREINQRLQSQRAQLEQEMADLQKQARDLEAPDGYAQNSIIQALQQAAHHSAQPSAWLPDILPAASEQQTTPAMPMLYPSQTINLEPHSRNRRIYTNTLLQAAALRATKFAPVSYVPNAAPLQQSRYPNTPAYRDNQIAETSSSLEGASHSINKTLPVDQQSKRTNQLVLRWFERWEKQDIQPTLESTHDE